MVSLDDLKAQYEMPGVLEFDEPQPGFARARLTTAACTAEFYLHGAHITGWQPAGSNEPIIFLSPRAVYEPGKAIRGGIPVIFPWFGARTAEVTGGRTDGGQHGFARTSEWTLAFAAMIGDELRVALTLGPDEVSRSAGFDGFRVAMEVSFGRDLLVRLTVGNEGAEPLVFEEALHTYYRVGDAEQVRTAGLGGTEFLDKTDSFARKRQSEEPLTMTSETDRAYLNTEADVVIDDPVFARRIVVAKGGSRSTVVWNPWATLARRVGDLGADVWREFVCVETANVAENRVTLAPQSAHTMELRVRVEAIS